MNSNQNPRNIKLKICSACLVGINCKWNGKSNPSLEVIEMLRQGEILPLCPEQLGGLTTPRPACGIINGTGKDVINKKAKVIDHNGKDHTKKFIKGSKEVLRIAKELGLQEAILKSTSPCCSSGGKVWQMSKVGKKYKNRLVIGNGVLAAMLKENGISVVSENEI